MNAYPVPILHSIRLCPLPLLALIPSLLSAAPLRNGSRGLKAASPPSLRKTPPSKSRWPHPLKTPPLFLIVTGKEKSLSIGGYIHLQGEAGELTEFYATWEKYDFTNVTLGQFKTPYGYEQLLSDTKLPFTERSLPSDRLTLSRQIALMASGKFLENRLIYVTGVFNGNKTSGWCHPGKAPSNSMNPRGFRKSRSPSPSSTTAVPPAPSSSAGLCPSWTDIFCGSLAPKNRHPP